MHSGVTSVCRLASHLWIPASSLCHFNLICSSISTRLPSARNIQSFPWTDIRPYFDYLANLGHAERFLLDIAYTRLSYLLLSFCASVPSYFNPVTPLFTFGNAYTARRN